LSDLAVATTQRSPALVLRDFLELSKSRIVLMILITTAAGFIVGSMGVIEPLLLIHTLAGTALVAMGANAGNEYMERDYDALMKRTMRRPLPDHRMSPRVALLFTALSSATGLAWLLAYVNPLASALAALTLLTYLFVYTPLKRITSLSTLIGSVPGAIPPVIGWAAARGELGNGALALFAILFLWQMPHFLAIGYLYREDYARAGFRMLGVIDPDGVRSGRQSLWFSLALLPVSLLLPAAGIGGVAVAAGALGSALVFVYAALRFFRSRERGSARSLFMISNVYLIAVMAVVVTGAFF
jgi:heme o synthase